MDKSVIAEKLESLRRCLARVSGATPSNQAALIANLDAQDIIVLNLERAVQCCLDIAAHLLSDLPDAAPKTMADTFTALQQAGVISPAVAERMRKAVGFRNIAVHEYQALDLAIVLKIATAHLDDFRAFAQAVVAWSGI
jgi:uncharacterized protein YutE (UPF0331/DUF86 family)